MGIRAPREPVYYYECSAGRFRLVYFVPPVDLAKLREQGKISERAVEDFPDGVDLGCTEADFDDFEQSYGWRPTTAPELIQRSFFALLSSTRRWRSFRGSGMIPARDLAPRLDDVAAELRTRGAEAPPRHAVAGAPPAARRAQRTVESRMRRVLEKMPFQGIDPRRDLRRQRFSRIAMEAEGESPEQVFSRLHEKRRR